MICTHSPNVLSLTQEVYEIKYILPGLIDMDTVFVDVEAYIGLYRVYTCKRFRKVLAVEPNPMALMYLKTNVTLNNRHNTIVVPKAISNKKV